MATRSRLAAADGRHAALLTALVCVLLAAALGLTLGRLGSVQHQLKALLIVVAGITMIAAALRPAIGLVVLIALVPFEIHFYGTGSDELLLVGLAVVIGWRIKTRAIPVWVGSACGLLIVGSLVAAIGAHSQISAVWGAVRWLAGTLVLAAALTLTRDRRDASRRMVDILSAAAVIVVAFAFAQKAGVYVLVGAPFLAGHPSSFFGYYTNYAGYAAMIAVLASGEVLIAVDRRNFSRAWRYGAVLVFVLTGIAISGSRGGLLALAAGWLLLIALNVRRGSIVAQAVVVLLIVGVGAYFATPHSAIVSIQQRLTEPTSSLTEEKQRSILQHAGARALEENPFGLGFANFSYYLKSYVRSDELFQTFGHAQDTPIQIGLDAGFLGLAGFLMLFVWPTALVLARGKGGSGTVRASAFAAALGGFMAQGLYDYLFYEIAFIVLVLAMVGGTVHALRTDAPELARGLGSSGLGPGQPRLVSSALSSGS